jgi:hypothetical protein
VTWRLSRDPGADRAAIFGVLAGASWSIFAGGQRFLTMPFVGASDRGSVVVISRRMSGGYSLTLRDGPRARRDAPARRGGGGFRPTSQTERAETQPPRSSRDPGPNSESDHRHPSFGTASMLMNSQHGPLAASRDAGVPGWPPPLFTTAWRKANPTAHIRNRACLPSKP